MTLDSIKGFELPSFCGQPSVGTKPRGLSLRKLASLWYGLISMYWYGILSSSRVTHDLQEDALS